MEHLHQNAAVRAAGLALLDAVRAAYPGLLPALEDMGIEVVTARGAISVRAVRPDSGELVAAPPAPELGGPPAAAAGATGRETGQEGG